MITIENLLVHFEAEREKDEVRFAELFASHIERHERARHERRLAVREAEADRSLEWGGAG